MNPREEIKNIAPKLSQWEYNEGYKVPPGYFDNLSNNVIERVKQSKNLEPYFQSLPDQVMNRIKQENKAKVFTIRPFFKNAIAAAVLLAVGTLIWANMKKDIVEPSYALFDESEELNYIVNEISMEDIFDSEFVDDEMLDEIFANEEDPFSADDSIEDLLIDIDDEILEEFL